MDALKLVINPLYSRFETLAKLGLLKPQMLTADEIRELSQLALDHMKGAKEP